MFGGIFSKCNCVKSPLRPNWDKWACDDNLLRANKVSHSTFDKSTVELEKRNENIRMVIWAEFRIFFIVSWAESVKLGCMRRTTPVITFNQKFNGNRRVNAVAVDLVAFFSWFINTNGDEEQKNILMKCHTEYKWLNYDNDDNNIV